MATFGNMFSEYPTDIKPYTGPYRTDEPATDTTQAAPITKEQSIWQNPGFWAEVGKIGSALLSGSPRLKGLSAASSAASEYHTGKQMDRAMTKMLSNVAAGKAPMEGFSNLDTKGLTPAQVENINKTGLSEADKKLEEKYKEIDKKYKEALIGDIEKKQKESETKMNNWNMTIKGWEDGSLKKPSFISDEMIPLLKGLGAEKGEALLSDIVKATKQNPDTAIVTDKKGGNVKGVDKNTGVVRWTLNITPDEGEEGAKAKVGNTSKGDEMAFMEMLPKLRENYLSVQKDPAAAAKLQGIMNMLEDPMKAGQARTMLLGYATPEMQAQFRKRSNQIAASLNAGKGYPEPDKKETPASIQDVTTKLKVDQAKVNKIAADLAKKLKRPPTPTEVKEAYETGGK